MISGVVNFQREYSTRTPSELQTIAVLLEKLNARKKRLVDRQSAFEKLLTDAWGLLEAHPEESLKKFDIAERIGKADASENLPDLLSDLKPSLAVRRSRAEDQRFSLTRNETIKSANSAMRADGSQLSEAISLLKTLEQQYAGRSDEDLRDIRDLRQSLEKRQATLKSGKTILMTCLIKNRLLFPAIQSEPWNCSHKLNKLAKKMP